jgi:hypothetical protein
MAMERERERRRRQQQPATPADGALEPARDAAALARAAAASADGIAAEPSGIEITIRTTTSRTADLVRLVATPDTPITEVMEEACARLGVRDRQRYVLVANGEVLGDGDRPLGDLVGEGEGTALETRLVRKPEAGAHAPAGS